MSKRLIVLFLIAALVICVVLLSRSCGDAALPAVTDNATSPVRVDAQGADIGRAEAEARAGAISQQRDEAMRAAVSTLHRYLAALGGADRAKADAFWAGNRPPAVTSEADLRSLKDLRALRTENGTPKPLDSEAVPNALEIPVVLRASLKGQPVQRYRGWYRMRRAVADGGWEITSASVAVEAR